MATIYELMEKMSTLGQQIKADAEWIMEKAADPSVDMKAIEEKEAHRNDLQKRFDMLKDQHDKLEAEQRASVERQRQQQKTVEGDPAKAAQEARGKFYRAAITGDSAGLQKAYEGLGAIPAQDADLGHGDNLLPTNLASELLTEPFETNSLRQVEPVSNITGLEEAKLEFDIEDADLAEITDKETALEIETDSNLVKYGRFKTKVFVTVKDTVLHGSPFALASVIENGLRSALAIKEKMRAFAQSPDTDHAHMSFYSTVNDIKQVEGTTMLDAIMAAWADLADMYSGNASVIMRKQDYVAMIRELSNGAEALFGKKPEEVIGIPVVFNDRAVIPVVGDFRYSKQNYDIGTIYETDKDGKAGEYYFILTAWGDHRIRLKSAFRLAKVNP